MNHLKVDIERFFIVLRELQPFSFKSCPFSRRKNFIRFSFAVTIDFIYLIPLFVILRLLL